MRIVFEAYIALKIAVLGIFYAQPALFIKGNFDLFVSVVVMAIILKAPKLPWGTKHHQVMSERNLKGFTGSTVHSLRSTP